MLKKSLLLLLACMTSALVGAQGVLEVDDLSQANAVYSSEGEKAAVEIRCNHDIPLKFTSTMDKSVDLFSTEIQGTDSVYFIELQAVIAVIVTGVFTRFRMPTTRRHSTSSAWPCSAPTAIMQRTTLISPRWIR